jgi:hypothetical protein
MNRERTSPVIEAEEFSRMLIEQVVNSGKRRRLEVILSICLEKAKSGDGDFSVTDIANKAKKVGGPSEQTIRNKAGIQYRVIIDRFRKASHDDKKRAVGANGIDDLLSRISGHVTDSQMRAELLLSLSELRSLRRQITIMRMNISKGMLINVSPNAAVEPLVEESINSEVSAAFERNFTMIEIDAVKKFLSEDGLFHNDLSITEDGRLINSKGREFSKFGLVSALRKIIL